jgi:hypothetical protein
MYRYPLYAGEKAVTWSWMGRGRWTGTGKWDAPGIAQSFLWRSLRCKGQQSAGLEHRPLAS